MTTREKIIVGVMCLTIAYGAYELMGARKPKAKTSPQADPVAELKNFVLEVSQKLVGDKLGEEYQYMIEQAGDQWTKDPFLHSSTSLKKNLTERVLPKKLVPTERPPELTYTGFMQIGDTRMAILNGIEYARGESLNLKDYFVKDILPTRVVIGRLNNLETIQLPIAEIVSGIDK